MKDGGCKAFDALHIGSTALRANAGSRTCTSLPWASTLCMPYTPFSATSHARPAKQRVSLVAALRPNPHSMSHRAVRVMSLKRSLSKEVGPNKRERQRHGQQSSGGHGPWREYEIHCDISPGRRRIHQGASTVEL